MKSRLNSEGLISDFSFSVFSNTLFAAAGISAVSFLSSEEIRLRAGKKTLSVWGLDLALSEVGAGEVFIKGKIAKIEII